MILAVTDVGNWRIITGYNGAKFETCAWHETIPPNDQVWCLAETQRVVEVRDQHRRVVADIEAGLTPEVGT